MGPHSRNQNTVAAAEEGGASGIMTLVTDVFFTALIYGLLVPMVSSAFGYSLPRSLCLELACYYKAVHWTYSYLLPAIGHGVQRKSVALEYALYALTLLTFCFYILPSIGLLVTEKCISSHYCAYDYRRTALGYSVDRADGQWTMMRGQLWVLGSFAAVLIALHRAYVGGSPTGTRLLAPLWERFGERAAASADFHAASGFLFLVVQHGWHALLVVAICYFAYSIAELRSARFVPRTAATWLVWGTGLGVLCFKESYRLQYTYTWLQVFFDRSYGGMYSWQLPANFLVLRIVSYGLDAIRATHAVPDDDGDTGALTPAAAAVNESVVSRPLTRSALRAHNALLRNRKSGGHGVSERASESDSDGSARNTKDTEKGIVPVDHSVLQHGDKNGGDVTGKGTVAAPCVPGAEGFDPHAMHWHLPVDQYCWRNFIAYALYPPLYIGGPITSFNAFVYYLHRPQQETAVATYGVRWLACLALLEYLTYLFPFFSVVHRGMFSYLSAQEMVVVAYLLLKMMWLKFLVIWRFFRLWALADGQGPPENMLRCMSNNCSLGGFWRGWHASFNRWILRYMYLPLGGRPWQLLNVWPIFLFVAVWHDVEPKLVAWAVLNSGFFVLEGLATRLRSTAIYGRLSEHTQRGAAVAAGAVYVMVLVGVNLVGYAMGMGGVRTILDKLLCLAGLRTLVATFMYLTMGVCIMQAVRREKISINT